ncbi:type IV pre-pilin [mine drainage metagenome]|uniref:Type IV pre-pilin n=1 Tax=mine drainage metagenome TaxID=410659 RepID=T0ZMN2_9ZZZZ
MRNARGFTLLELMVVLIIVAIVLTFAIPSFRTLLMNSRINDVVGNLSGALNYARNTALSRDMPIGVCPISPPASAGQAPGTACLTAFGSAANGTAWMVHSGPSSNPVPLSTYLLPAGEQISITSSGSSQITFNGRGLLALGGGTFTVCDARGASSAQAIEVNTAGYVQISATRGSAPDGSALSCP